MGVGVLLAAGTTALTLTQIQEHKAFSWQVPRASFDVFYKTPPQIEIVPTLFSTNGFFVYDGNQGGMGIAQSVKEIIQCAWQTDKLRTFVATGLPPEKYDFFAKLSDQDDPDQPARWTKALQEKIAIQFGVKGRFEMRETNVLLLKIRKRKVRASSHRAPCTGTRMQEPSWPSGPAMANMPRSMSRWIP